MVIFFFYSFSGGGSLRRLHKQGGLITAGLDVLGLESLEGGDVDVRDEGVQLVGGVLVLVPHAGEADTDAEGNVPGRQHKRKGHR